MKYFAILKDSLRESLDSKVLYVMFGLSTLMILLVGSLSFQPLAAEKTMEQFFFVVDKKGDQRPPMLAMILNGKKTEKSNPQGTFMQMVAMYPYRLIKVDLVSGDADAPASEYALTISKIILNETEKQSMFGRFAELSVDDPSKRPQRVREIFKEAESAGYLQVENVESTDVEDAAKETARFRVTVKGTPKTVRIWVTEISWIFGAFPLPDLTAPLSMQLFGLSYLVITVGSWVTVLVGIVVTSFFFPNMLRKGTVDLLLVKPIQRWVLLLYKYVGGLTFMFLCTTYAVGGIWLVLGLRSGLWPNGSLLLIFSLTYFFCILYAISTFVGVVTRSTVTAIMLTLAAYAFLGASGFTHLFFEAKVTEEQAKEKHNELMKTMKQEDDGAKARDGQDDDEGKTRWADSYWLTGSRLLQAVSPRTEDLNKLNSLILLTDFLSGNLTDMPKFDNSERNWWLSLLVSMGWIAFFLGLAALWFTFKDY